eukprot:Seg6877.1 transcript_id=Seg6877.1/GoldUCD/mRNA.D3Y31 product="hypothetical protein" protein_id=Seg6877.1/GoldUCD/D3Y31
MRVIITFARRGFVSEKMETHLWSKHKSELAELGIVKNKQPEVTTTEQSAVPTQEFSNCINVETVPDPAPEKNPQFSPIRPFIVKKSKILTPISSDPSNVQFMPPPVSPLVHESTLIEEQFPHDNQTFDEQGF